MVTIARYDGEWLGGLHLFTTLTGPAAGASWTARAGDDLRAKMRAVDERFAAVRCPRCGGRLLDRGVAVECVRCPWEHVRRP